MKDEASARDEAERMFMERKGKIEDLDRSFDLEFWQAQTDTARFAPYAGNCVDSPQLNCGQANLHKIRHTAPVLRPPGN
jgi:hypothetical protein